MALKGNIRASDKWYGYHGYVCILQWPQLLATPFHCSAASLSMHNTHTGPNACALYYCCPAVQTHYKIHSPYRCGRRNAIVKVTPRRERAASMLSNSCRWREPVSLLWKLEQTEGISSFVSEVR